MSYKLLLNAIFLIIIPRYIVPLDPASPMFYTWMLAINMLHHTTSTLQYTSQMALFAQISDPAFGGTYMSLLNTLANLSFKYTHILSLSLMDRSHVTLSGFRGGEEGKVIHGFYVQIVIASMGGILWLWYCLPFIQSFQHEPKSVWSIHDDHTPSSTSSISSIDIVMDVDEETEVYELQNKHKKRKQA